MLLDPDGGSLLREQKLASAAPLSMKRPLERAHASPWESHGRERIIVQMDKNDGTFHRVHVMALPSSRELGQQEDSAAVQAAFCPPLTGQSVAVLRHRLPPSPW